MRTKEMFGRCIDGFRFTGSTLRGLILHKIDPTSKARTFLLVLTSSKDSMVLSLN